MCPVRALISYKRRIGKLAHLIGPDQKLFRGFVGRSKGIIMKAHSISYHLKQMVKLSYDNIISSVIKMKPHEIRAISASLASFKHMPIKKILAKGFWRAESTLAKFYLKDLSKYNRKVRGDKAVVLA